MYAEMVAISHTIHQREDDPARADHASAAEIREALHLTQRAADPG